MDIISHGLYGSIAFGRRNRKAFWTAFFFGVAPDLFSFGIFFVQRLFQWESRGVVPHGKPDISTIPEYVGNFYNVTHSLVIFLIVFSVVWYFRKKPFWEMLAWPLHILVDIPTHSTAFFATPFLWPLLDYKFDGVSWGNWFIFIPNVIFLVSIYIYYFLIRPRLRVKSDVK